MTTVSNVQRSKKVNKAYAMITTGKILVTSTITIEGFGTRSSTGEGWADDENGTTRAQAQAFRRACAEFGLGRYLRELEGWSCKVPVNGKATSSVRTSRFCRIAPFTRRNSQKHRKHERRAAKSSRSPLHTATFAGSSTQPPAATGATHLRQALSTNLPAPGERHRSTARTTADSRG